MAALPLIQHYPQLDRLARVSLCDLPTPVDELAVEDISVLVKRDDLTSAAYGGNKVRKLEFLLGDARERGARAVITFGAYGSNHALATAVHATRLGLEPHVVLSPQEPGPYAARTLRAHAGLGTHIHVVDGWDGAREAVRVRAELTRRDGIEPYVIPMGGTNACGALGYVNAAFEMAGSAPDAVYLAAGTLGTAVGLAVGFAAVGAATRVVAVRVTPDKICNEAIAERVAMETVELLRGADPSFPALRYADLRFELRHDHFEPGYGIPTPATLRAVETASDAGLHLETTYTGKAFSALLEDARAGAFRRERVMFLDTYNSAPMPAPGPVEALPDVLQDYVALCDELFGPALTTLGEGDTE